MKRKELSKYIRELETYSGPKNDVWSIKLVSDLVVNNKYEPQLGIIQEIIKPLISTFAYCHKERISAGFWEGLSEQEKRKLNNPNEWMLSGVDDGINYNAFDGQIKIRVNIISNEAIIHSLECS